ncbi:putative NOT transcription complex subunit VIP2 [Hordeum vulgare]|nr:putative NOT transcription complex subunit VIP2 [Hordeum vulgare]
MDLKDITSVGSIDLHRLNYGMITLVPGIIGASEIRQFCPITMINVIFRILAKGFVNRVRIRRAARLPLDPEEDFEKEEVVKEEKEKEQELTEEALPLGVREKASAMEEDMDLWA